MRGTALDEGRADGGLVGGGTGASEEACGGASTTTAVATAGGVSASGVDRMGATSLGVARKVTRVATAGIVAMRAPPGMVGTGLETAGLERGAPEWAHAWPAA